MRSCKFCPAVLRKLVVSDARTGRQRCDSEPSDGSDGISLLGYTQARIFSGKVIGLRISCEKNLRNYMYTRATALVIRSSADVSVPDSATALSGLSLIECTAVARAVSAR